MDAIMETLELIEEMDQILANMDENVENEVQTILEEEDNNAKTI